MGNSQANFSFSNSTTHQWKTVIPPRRQLTGTPSLCQAEDPSFEADCYDITVHSTLEQQMEILFNRKSISNDHIVKLLDVRLKKKQMFECNLKERLQIYTQKIICRLGEFPLDKNQALFLLRETILAFTVLVNFCKQYFIVAQKMIGFSSEGWVRIWLNENFGYSELKQQNLARSQYEMIISIVKCFENLGIRVQDYYSFSRFQQIIAHLNMRLDGLQTQCIMKIICSKAKKCQISDQTCKKQIKQSQTEASVTLQKHQGSEMIQNHLENRYHQCENPSGKFFKQNIKPFRQINILQEFEKKITAYRSEARQSRDIPSQVFSTSKKSLKQLTNPLNTSSSLKLIDRPKKDTTISTSVQFSKKKNIQFLDTTNITDCQELAQVPPFRETREIPLQRPKLHCQPLPLHPQLDIMSRITERSHEDETQYLGTERQTNPNDPEVNENRSIRRSHSSRKPIACSSENKQENYFTKIDL